MDKLSDIKVIAAKMHSRALSTIDPNLALELELWSQTIQNTLIGQDLTLPPEIRKVNTNGQERIEEDGSMAYFKFTFNP